MWHCGFDLLSECSDSLFRRFARYPACDWELVPWRTTFPSSSVIRMGISAACPSMSMRVPCAWVVLRCAVQVHAGLSVPESIVVDGLLKTDCTQRGLALTTLETFRCLFLPRPQASGLKYYVHDAQDG